MQPMTLILGSSLLAVASTCGAGSPEPPAFVPGEVLVKFAAASAVGARLGTADPDRLAGELAPQLAAVSEEVGVPLRAERLLSGGEILLAVDRQALAARLLASLRRDARVESATAGASPATSADDARPEVRVTLAAGGPLAAGAAKAWKRKRESFDAARDFARELGQSLGFELTARVAGESEVDLTVDLDALTEALLARLDQLPEVEYAQLNYVAGAFG